MTAPLSAVADGLAVAPAAMAPPPVRVAPFRLKDLAVLAYAQGFTLWHYRAPGEIDVVLTNNYFADAAGIFAVGDRVMVTGPSGSRDLHVAATGPDTVEVSPTAPP